MDVEQLFQSTLTSALPCPVSKEPAGGDHDTYAAFAEVLGTYDGYASNEPHRLVHMVQFHVYSKQDDGTHRALFFSGIDALRAAGVRVRAFGPDTYEQETTYHHIAATCEWAEKI